MYDFTIKVSGSFLQNKTERKQLNQKLDILLELHVDLVNVINKRFIDIVHVTKS